MTCILSPLDGTVSCKTCWALVLDQNYGQHCAWHIGRGE